MNRLTYQPGRRVMLLLGIVVVIVGMLAFLGLLNQVFPPTYVVSEPSRFTTATLSINYNDVSNINMRFWLVTLALAGAAWVGLVVKRRKTNLGSGILLGALIALLINVYTMVVALFRGF
jgi:uncharacterized membrane protein